MISAPRVAQPGGAVATEKFGGRLREVAGRGRCPDLIGYDAQFIFLPEQTPYGEEEVLAPRRVHPARAQYQMSAADVLMGLGRSSSIYGASFVPSKT